MDDTQAVEALHALAHPTRLQIVKRLMRAGPDGLGAGALAKAVEAAPSRASFHLNVLADAQLVASTRRAREIVYRARFENLGALVSHLLVECCADHPQVRCCL